jgi:energy-converting hydrogenase Eha subunit E
MRHTSWKAVQHASGAGTGPASDAGASPGPSHDLSGAVVELAMFLTFDEVVALESAAQANGMTVARLLRSVIRESLDHRFGSVTRLENRQGRGS